MSDSNTKDLLIEIGTEELPPKALKKLSDAFTAGVVAGLKDASLEASEVISYAAPRRLAVLLKDIPVKQADQSVERKGPAKAAAFDAEGKPTKAVEGFAALSSSERAVKDDEAAAGAAAPGRPQGGVARWRRWRGLHRSRRAATASGLASRGRGGVGSAVWWRAQRAGGRSGGESGHLPPRHHRARDRGAPKRCFIFCDKNFPSPSPIKFNRKLASLRPQTKLNSTEN